MSRLLSFHNFRINENDPSGARYTIDEIKRSILENDDDDIADVFFVGEIPETAIFLSYNISHDSGSADIDSEVSQEASDYSIEYDKKDLYRFFKNNLTSSEEETDSPDEGPKFSIDDIVEVADNLLRGKGILNYVDGIDTSNVFVTLMAKDSRSNQITIEGFIDDESLAKIESFLYEKFSKDLIEGLISNIIGYQI